MPHGTCIRRFLTVSPSHKPFCIHQACRLWFFHTNTTQAIEARGNQNPIKSYLYTSGWKYGREEPEPFLFIPPTFKVPYSHTEVSTCCPSSTRNTCSPLPSTKRAGITTRSRTLEPQEEPSLPAVKPTHARHATEITARVQVVPLGFLFFLMQPPASPLPANNLPRCPI